MKESLVKTFLRNIFGILPVKRNALRHRQNSLPMTKNQFLESLRISALCRSHQRAVGVFVYTGRTRRFHECDPPPPLRHKEKKLTSARATVHIERTGICSTAGEPPACLTTPDSIHL